MTEIFPYEPPVKLAENLFQITGSLKFPIPRNMTIVRNGEGDLAVYSAIAMHEDGMRALEALGRPTHLVIPHRRHQMDAPFYKARYPNIRVIAPDPSVVREVKVDGDLRELSAYGINSYVLPGNTYQDVVMEITIPNGRALCVCESLGNVSMSGWMSVPFRLLGPPGGGFGVARAVRMREISDRERLRTWLKNQSKHGEIKAVLMGHGAAITRDVSTALRHASEHT